MDCSAGINTANKSAKTHKMMISVTQNRHPYRKEYQGRLLSCSWTISYLPRNILANGSNNGIWNQRCQEFCSRFWGAQCKRQVSSIQPPAGVVVSEEMVGTGPHGQRQLIARLDLGIGAESRHVLRA